MFFLDLKIDSPVLLEFLNSILDHHIKNRFWKSIKIENDKMFSWYSKKSMWLCWCPVKSKIFNLIIEYYLYYWFLANFYCLRTNHSRSKYMWRKRVIKKRQMMEQNYVNLNSIVWLYSMIQCLYVLISTGSKHKIKNKEFYWNHNIKECKIATTRLLCCDSVLCIYESYL